MLMITTTDGTEVEVCAGGALSCAWHALCARQPAERGGHSSLLPQATFLNVHYKSKNQILRCFCGEPALATQY